MLTKMHTKNGFRKPRYPVDNPVDNVENYDRLRVYTLIF